MLSGRNKIIRGVAVAALLMAAAIVICAASCEGRKKPVAVSEGDRPVSRADSVSDEVSSEAPVIPVDVSVSDVKIEMGYRLTRHISASGGDTIGWSSSDESIASVDGEGNVRANDIGSCVITATNEFGRSAQCSVTVKKVCYLTFDDGPKGSVYDLLDTLKKYRVNGTFFLVNTIFIDSVKRMVDEGHVLALHTNVNSTKVCYRSMYSYYDDLDILNDTLEELVGIRSDIIRYPGGTSNRQCDALRMRRILNGADDLGYRVFDWTASAQDAARDMTAEKSAANVIRTCVGKEEVVLMHDMNFTSDALKIIIPHLRKNGYIFETLDHYPDRTLRHKCLYSYDHPDLPAESVSVKPKKQTLEVGEETEITASMTPDDSTDYVVWQSSDAKIAAVSKAGLVKGIAPGEAVITARASSGKTAACKITVTVDASE